MGIVKEVLGHFGADESAFHTLRELDNTFLPEMMAAYRSEIDPQTRSLIVEAIWQPRTLVLPLPRRSPSGHRAGGLEAGSRRPGRTRVIGSRWLSSFRVRPRARP